MNRQPRTLRVCFLAAIAVAPAGGSAQSSVQATPEHGTLVEVSVMGTDDHVVVGLVGDQALSGEVHEISVLPFRVFVDFLNVVPEVDAVTAVGRGGVSQVRVALNQANPPVTRVVLDLTHRSTYRVEEDPAASEFRIIVGTATAVLTTRSDAPPAPTDPASVGATSAPIVQDYALWFARRTEDIQRLLSTHAAQIAEDESPETVGSEWQRLLHELEVVAPPVSLQTAHDLLVTALRLWHVGAGEQLDGGTNERDRAAARAAASLLVNRALELVEAELATIADGDQ